MNHKTYSNRLITLIRGTRGQSMVEFAVAMPAVILLLWAGLYMANIYLVKHKTLAAARYSTWKFAREEKTVEELKTAVAKYYFDNNTTGLYVTEQNTPTDMDDLGGFLDTVTGKAFDFLNGVMTDQDSNVSSIKIQYEVPPKFGALDIRDMHPANYKVESSHYVTANGWDGCHSDVHDIFSMLWEIIEEIFTELTGLDFDL